MSKAILVDGKSIDYSALPEHMQDGARLYMEHGIAPGSFLTAILCNDFMGACAKADRINRERLFDYAQWLYNHAPRSSFGSRARVENWIASFSDNAKAEGTHGR